MANMATVKKGNYVRRKQRSPSPVTASPSSSTKSRLPAATSTAATGGAATPSGSSKSAGQPADPNRVQFEQQEDFISFDFSDGERDTGHSHSTRDSRNRDRGGKRKHDESLDGEQEEGTRQLRKREKERSTPWCDEPGLSWSSHENATSQLNAEAKSYISYISPTPVEHELRMFTIEIIRRTIKSKYADADVECFGSVGTGLYLPGGDIDLVVLCPSMPSPPLKPSSSLLHRLASLLLTSSIAQPSSLVVIAKARVPIVKFTTRYGGFQVDLSVNQKNGVDAAIRVRSMLEDFAFREEGYVEPGAATGGMSIKGKASSSSSSSSSSSTSGAAVRKGKERADDVVVVEEAVDHGVARSLVLLVKGYLAQRGMNEVFTGGLGSYSIICLVISFLQLHPRIQSAQIQPSRNIGLLFLEFLEYYGKHFNFDEAGITLKGRGGYYNKHDKGWFRPNQPYLLSIEDPNDPTNDVSGGSHNILRVRQTLAGGFDTLSATVLQRQSVIDHERNPTVVKLSDKSLPNADSDPPSDSTRSLLGSIVGMTRAGVEARKANLRLWDDGVLQKILERIRDAAGGGEVGGKKAMKRAMKEERDRQRRERTVAKLERRIEEKERKAERKKDKKRSREASAVVETTTTAAVPLVDRKTIEEARAAAASLKGLAGGGGADEDSEYSTRSAAKGRRGGFDDDDSEGEEEGSRYSVGVPAVTVVARKNQAQPRPLYTSHTSDDDDDEADSSDDDQLGEGEEDVVLGGGGGDFVRFDSAQHSEQDDADTAAGVETTDSSGSDSSDQVMQSLVPAAGSKALKINGAAAAAKQQQRKVVKEAPPKKRSKRDEGSSNNKKAKSAAKNAYWGAKGVRE